MKHNGIEIQTMFHDSYPVKTWIHDGKIVFALCTVTFVDWDNTVLSTQNILYGGSATKPSNPSRSGYTFTGWSGSYTNVTADVTITATYSKNTVSYIYYDVTFVDHDGTVLKTQNVRSGSSATPPSDPTRYGYTFYGWSGSYTGVTSNVTITATYTKTVYTVSEYASAAGLADGDVSQFQLPVGELTPSPTVIISATVKDMSLPVNQRVNYISLSNTEHQLGLPRTYQGTPYFMIAFNTKGNSHTDYTSMLITAKYYIV